jgi:predicted dithiol-disulfide oxidoreductase (DUF899 family)
MREIRNAYKILDRKPEGKRHVETWARWEDNIKTDFE